MPPSHPFRSARLLYRAIESPDDDDFFHAIQSDPLSFASSTPSILTPASRKITTGVREAYQERSMIAVMICLPTTDENLALAGIEPTPTSKSGNLGQATDKDDDKSKPKPTTFPSLVRPGMHDRGIPIGAMDLAPHPSGERYVHHRNADIGIDIAPKYQNRGYGGEALEWIIEWGFRHAGLHRIGIRVLGWNEGALRLYQRIGFVMESREREKFWSEGRWWDDLGLGILEGEWRERRKEIAEGKGKGQGQGV
ncbi:hypothetical protein MMC10_004039 [Thelotrema lepadinum]|nr:hypothetical protein [Thelotrema lepadinum]